ncbi:MAG: chemotaxis protein CheV [Oscillibacter sp.]|jgi:two-component system chemotaxis response regulator CheV|nr:chemotaxis protein CheV [Oscillibacter sp.]MCI9002280.1 chemotaxis protein CheV [Oscillibacter sp.]
MLLEEDKRGILLESGTNEIEVMEFTINESLYGINVAKVKEILVSQPVKHMPHAHPAVEGIFKPRDKVITVVDLPTYLMGEAGEKKSKDLFIITNFNKMNIAFRVHTVVGISRISWKSIQKPDKTVAGGEEGIATGIAQCGDDLVTILDFEKIVAEIAPETTIQMSEIEQLGHRERSEAVILVAEDSVLLSKMIEEALHKSGYVNTRMFPDGSKLWEYLSSLRGDPDLNDKVALIITDIEMPQMDGHRLTKLVKDDRDFKHLPLIIFSSLITEEMRRKGKELGADEQMSKPEIGHLVRVIDHLLEVGQE